MKSICSYIAMVFAVVALIAIAAIFIILLIDLITWSIIKYRKRHEDKVTCLVIKREEKENE